ncbi:hypothetical protein ACWDWS_02230 [Streptomyces sp. NPDC003328]
MSFTLTDEQVSSTLRQVVSENPEKVYAAPENMQSFPGDSSCFYVHVSEDGPDEAGCIVGQVLNRLGVPLEVLQKGEGWSAADILTRLEISGVSSDMGTTLRRIQRRQDDGEAWGDAYTAVTGLPVPELVKA